MHPEFVSGFENLVNRLVKNSRKDVTWFTSNFDKGLNLYNEMIDFLYDPANSGLPEVKWLDNLEAVDKTLKAYNQFTHTLVPDEDKDSIKQGSELIYLAEDFLNINNFNLSQVDATLIQGHTENLVCSIISGEYIKFKIVNGVGSRKDKVSEMFYHKSRFLLKSHKGNQMGSNKLLESICNGTRKVQHTLRTSTIIKPKISMVDYVYIGSSPVRNRIVEIDKENNTIIIGRVTDTGSLISEFREVSVDDARLFIPKGFDSNGITLTVDDLVRIPMKKAGIVLDLLGYKKPESVEGEPLSHASAQWTAYSIIFFFCSFKVVDIRGEVVFIKIVESKEHPGLIEKAGLKDLLFCVNKSYIEYDQIRNNKGVQGQIITQSTSTTEDDLGKRNRENRERDERNKAFDKEKGPYNLQNYMGKLIKINSLDNTIFKELDNKSGQVSSIDNELGRIVVKFEYHKDIFFRESLGESKHITIISEAIVSSEENPELV